MVAEMVSDLVFWADVLSQTKFKPWWETIRAYAVVGLHAVAFLIIYTINPAKSLICLPTENATSGSNEIGGDYINLYCSQYIHWFIRYFGYIAFGSCIIIHMLYSWWLFVPRVKFTFQSLRRFDDKCDKLEDLMDDIVDVERTRSSATDEEQKERKRLEKSLKKIIKEINHFNPSIWISVPTIYIVRNLIALIGICVSVFLLYSIEHFTEEPFDCVVASFKVECSYDLIDKFEPFVYSGMILLSVAGVISFISILTTAICDRTPTSDLDPLKRKRDYSFALHFGEHSFPISQNADLLLKKLPSRFGAAQSEASISPSPYQQQFDDDSQARVQQDGESVNIDTSPLINKV